MGMTRIAGLGWLALVATGCTTPIDLVDTDGVADTGDEGQTDGSAGSGSSDGDGSDQSDDGDTDNGPICAVGTEGCPCDRGTCDAGLACAFDVCAPLAGDCGNSTVDPGEGCDDGNLTDGDGCNADCLPSARNLVTLSVGSDTASIATAVTTDGNAIIVAGGDNDVQASDAWVHKYDGQGTELWAAVVPDPAQLWSVTASDDGAIAVSGGLFPEEALAFGMFYVARYDADGEPLGEFVSESHNAAGMVAADPAGGFLVAAGIAAAVRLEGDELTEQATDGRTIGGLDVTPGGVLTAFGDMEPLVYWVGSFDTTQDVSTVSWQQTMSERPMDLATDDAGNVVVLGQTSADDEWWLRRFGPAGEEQWKSVLELDSLGRPNAVAVDSHGRIVVVAEGGHPNLGGGRWIAKYHPDGEVLWVVEEDEGEARDVSIGDDDQVVVCGRTETQGWIGVYAP